MNRPMKVYIAGPMTGLPEHNFPAFNAAAEAWRKLGWEVVNPAELDDPSLTHEELAKVPAQWYYHRDLGYLLGFLGTPYPCDAIARLPDWDKSTGAKGETYVAEWMKMRVFDANYPARQPVTDHEFVDATNVCCDLPDYMHEEGWRNDIAHG